MPNKPSTKPISDEIKFLIVCCQTEPSDDDISFIQKSSIIHHPSSIIELAASHGILPLVYKTIKNLNASSLSDDSRSSRNTSHVTRNTKLQGDSSLNTLLSELKQHYMSIAQRNMLMTGELIRIMKLLEENNIKALAFKGPALSQMAYGDITLRQYVDLDVLVKKEDIYKIDSLLTACSYERVIKLTPVQEKIYMKNGQDLGFYHPKSGLILELHWSLLNEDYPIQINLDKIWEDPQIIRINGREIKTFQTEDLLIYLCIHGSKHLWERIEWIKDVDLLIRSGDIDWEKIVKEVNNSGFEIMIYLGLSLASKLFETPLPQPITKYISNMKVLSILLNIVLQSWQSSQSTFQKTYSRLKFFPGIKEQVLYLHKILFKPSLNDYQFTSLPKSLYWAYYIVRPYRVIKEYLTRQNNS